MGSAENIGKDHVQPVSLGGPDGIDNVQPLCVACNAQKMTQTADYRPLGRSEFIERTLSGRSTSVERTFNGRQQTRLRLEETRKEESKERENLRPAKPAGHIGSPEFLRFWDSYPRKLAKREAQRAWLKGTCDQLLGEILAGLESWKRCEQWKEIEHVPYPATWLNGRRWEHTPNNGLGASGLEVQRRELERKLGIGAR